MGKIVLKLGLIVSLTTNGPIQGVKLFKVPLKRLPLFVRRALPEPLRLRLIYYTC